MRRVLCAVLLAVLALGRVDGAGLPFSLSFTASTDLVNIGSDASIANVGTGTMVAWAYPTSVATPGKRIYQKGVSALNSTYIYLSFADGASGNIGFNYKRTTDLTVTSATTVAQANQWQFVAATWDVNAAAATDQRLYYGTLTTPASEPTYVTQQTGSGAHTSESSIAGFIGNKSNGSNQLSGSMAIFGLWTRVLSQDEIRRQQFVAARPVSLVNCAAFYVLAANGTGRVLNQCTPSVNNGTITGARATNAVLPFVGPRRPRL